MKLKFLIILFLLAFPCLGQINKKENNKLGTVKILIPPISVEGDLINDEQVVRVYLKGKGIENEMNYTNKGNYELSVPQGVYQIVLKDLQTIPIEYKRAKFSVTSNKITNISISPDADEVCDEQGGFVERPMHMRVLGNGLSLPFYDQLLIKKPFNLVVKYCQKQSVGQNINYKFAQLSYKNLTIYADEINFDKRNLSVEIRGTKDSLSLIEIEDCSREIEKTQLNLATLNLSKFICKKTN